MFVRLSRPLGRFGKALAILGMAGLQGRERLVPSMSTTSTSSEKLPLSVAQVSMLLSDQTRWRLLRELSKGELVPTTELAKRAGCTPDSAYKHLVVLREMGVVVQRYRGFYEMAPAFLPPAGSTTLHLGHCLVRLDTPL
jgi:DNA-binding transcriptional ArsR family regulator